MRPSLLFRRRGRIDQAVYAQTQPKTAPLDISLAGDLQPAQSVALYCFLTTRAPPLLAAKLNPEAGRSHAGDSNSFRRDYSHKFLEDDRITAL